MITVLPCDGCKHYKGLKDGWQMVCSAYPDGIPCNSDIGIKDCTKEYHFEAKDEQHINKK